MLEGKPNRTKLSRKAVRVCDVWIPPASGGGLASTVTIPGRALLVVGGGKKVGSSSIFMLSIEEGTSHRSSLSGVKYAWRCSPRVTAPILGVFV